MASVEAGDATWHIARGLHRIHLVSIGGAAYVQSFTLEAVK